jgi:hypothetical protein
MLRLIGQDTFENAAHRGGQFLFTAAPLRSAGATGSPVHPNALS